ncbi:serine hydrolase domain-containing protein [Streptomyces venetus]|uniref:Serine hydrolase domain-containing protein n=1 Tax=Streptomyces venetus TaxID=1701086 RepID=A0ABP8F2E8_9ACTN
MTAPRRRAVVVLASLALSLSLSLALHTPSAGTTTGPVTAEEVRREAATLLETARSVSVHVRVRDGRHTVAAGAGEAVLGTGRPVPRGAHFRAASVTKSFVAATVLHLVAERRLSLNDTVEHWLPGRVRGNGNDGSRITVRHLLQHTSGLYDYDSTELTGKTAPDFGRHRFDHISPEQLVTAALRHAPDFPPADPDDPEPRWSYSNTGYFLLGAIIERVTGRPWAVEVHNRIVRRAGLRGTRFPGDDPHLPEPYARTYHRFAGSGGYTDTTVRNMFWAGPAGALVSTSRDLDRFFTALLTGELLPPRELAAMRSTVPSNEEHQQFTPGMRYGLGLMRQPLSCGGSRWGHHGDLEGTFVRTGFTADGERSVVLTVNGRTTDDTRLLTTEKAMQGLIDRFLCRR